MLTPFFKGLVMGVAIAAPVGPIGVLCIRRTLSYGRSIGLVSGCGAATADALYGIVAAFGLSALSSRLVANAFYLQLIGGLFLCYLGLTTFLSANTQTTRAAIASISQSVSNPSSQHIFSAYITTLGLTLTNPATILSFLGIFSGLGITHGNYVQSVTLVFGVFSGSLLWWLVLVSGIAYLRRQLTAAKLARFNSIAGKVLGSVIFAFGIVALTTTRP